MPGKPGPRCGSAEEHEYVCKPPIISRTSSRGSSELKPPIMHPRTSIESNKYRAWPGCLGTTFIAFEYLLSALRRRSAEPKGELAWREREGEREGGREREREREKVIEESVIQDRDRDRERKERKRKRR